MRVVAPENPDRMNFAAPGNTSKAPPDETGATIAVVNKDYT